MKKVYWLALLFASLVVGYVVISAFQSQPFRCRICISFKGRTDCRTASGQTRVEAEQTAIVTACAQLSGGVIESNQCETTPPASVDWLKQPEGR